MSAPPAWIRYWACTDDSPLGRQALECLKALCHILPVRLIPLEFPVGPRWEPYAALALTPIAGHYVNVVCAPRSYWIRPNTLVIPATETKPSETFSGTMEIWTAGVRNVLIAPVAPPTDLESDTAKTARKYQQIIPVGHYEAWSKFVSAAPNMGADVAMEYPRVSEGWRTYDELRTLIIG